MERKRWAGIAIPISGNIDCDIKSIKRDNERYHIVIKGSIQQEEIVKIKVCTSNAQASNYMEQTLVDLKG